MHPTVILSQLLLDIGTEALKQSDDPFFLKCDIGEHTFFLGDILTLEPAE